MYVRIHMHAVCTCSWEMDRSELESVLQKSDEGTALI